MQNFLNNSCFTKQLIKTETVSSNSALHFYTPKNSGLSQEKLAEKANISRSFLSNIEAPNMAYSFPLDVFYNIADALDIAPEDLITAHVFPDEVIRK